MCSLDGIDHVHHGLNVISFARRDLFDAWSIPVDVASAGNVCHCSKMSMDISLTWRGSPSVGFGGYKRLYMSMVVSYQLRG